MSTPGGAGLVSYGLLQGQGSWLNPQGLLPRDSHIQRKSSALTIPSRSHEGNMPVWGEKRSTCRKPAGSENFLFLQEAKSVSRLFWWWHSQARQVHQAKPACLHFSRKSSGGGETERFAAPEAAIWAYEDSASHKGTVDGNDRSLSTPGTAPVPVRLFPPPILLSVRALMVSRLHGHLE